ncbi:MAG: mobilization protein [Polaromonas sp.]|nr:mobilization protein [Polaromonas sp.]
MAKSQKEKLAELLAKEAQIKAQIQSLKQRDSASERKNDARRKILIGGTILAKIKRGAWSQKQLDDLLSEELKADRDRALFGLPLLVINIPNDPAGEPDGGNRP